MRDEPRPLATVLGTWVARNAPRLSPGDTWPAPTVADLGTTVECQGPTTWVPRLVIGGRPTTGTCGHQHKRRDLAEHCAATHLLPHWAAIIDSPHHWAVYLAGPPGPTLWRVTWERANGGTGWENIAWADLSPTVEA